VIGETRGPTAPPLTAIYLTLNSMLYRTVLSNILRCTTHSSSLSFTHYRVKKKIARLLAAQAVATSEVLMSAATTALAAPSSTSSSSSSAPLPPPTTTSSASALSKTLPAPPTVPAQKKIVVSTGNVNSPKKNQSPIMARSIEAKKKVVKSHKKLTKKSKSILATNLMLAKTLNLKKPKKNKNPLRAKTVTETVTVPVTMSVTESVTGIIKNVGGDFLINDIGGGEVLRSSSVSAGGVYTHVASVGKGKEMSGELDQSQNAAVEITTEADKDVCVGEGKVNTPTKQKKNKEKKNKVKSNVLKDRETTKRMSPKMAAAALAVKRFNSVSASLPPPLPLSYSVSSVKLVSQASGAVQPSAPASSADTAVNSTNITQKAITAKIGIVATSNTAKQSSSVTDAAGTGAVTISASSIITATNSPPYTSSQAVNTSLTPPLLASSGVLTSTENYPHASAQASTVTAVTAAPAKRAKLSKSLTAAAQADSLGGAGPNEGKKKRKLSHIEPCVVLNEVTVAAPAPAASGEVVGLSSTAAADLSCAPKGSVPCTSGPSPSQETPLKESAVSTPTPTPGESPDTSVAFTGGAMTPLTSSTGSNRGSRRNRRDSESAEDTVVSSAEVTDDETPERGESFTVPPSFNIGDFTLL
jgi:hypothetical protein